MNTDSFIGFLVAAIAIPAVLFAIYKGVTIRQSDECDDNELDDFESSENDKNK